MKNVRKVSTNNYFKVYMGNNAWEYIFFLDRSVPSTADAFARTTRFASLARSTSDEPSAGRISAWNKVVGFEGVPRISDEDYELSYAD